MIPVLLSLLIHQNVDQLHFYRHPNPLDWRKHCLEMDCHQRGYMPKLSKPPTNHGLNQSSYIIYTAKNDFENAENVSHFRTSKSIILFPAGQNLMYKNMLPATNKEQQKLLTKAQQVIYIIYFISLLHFPRKRKSVGSVYPCSWRTYSK